MFVRPIHAPEQIIDWNMTVGRFSLLKKEKSMWYM